MWMARMGVGVATYLGLLPPHRAAATRIIGSPETERRRPRARATAEGRGLAASVRACTQGSSKGVGLGAGCVRGCKLSVQRSVGRRASEGWRGGRTGRCALSPARNHRARALREQSRSTFASTLTIARSSGTTARASTAYLRLRRAATSFRRVKIAQVAHRCPPTLRRRSARGSNDLYCPRSFLCMKRASIRGRKRSTRNGS